MLLDLTVFCTRQILEILKLLLQISFYFSFFHSYLEYIDYKFYGFFSKPDFSSILSMLKIFCRNLLNSEPFFLSPEDNFCKHDIASRMQLRSYLLINL